MVDGEWWILILCRGMDTMWKSIDRRKIIIVLLGLAVAFGAGRFAGFCLAGEKDGKPLSFDEMKELSFEELIDIEVISASRRPEKLSETAAAIYVITDTEIRRSGVSTIPDALRLAPGVHVARVNTHWWSISIRGFSDELYSNKLLVLIDGRSVYNPIYSGVFWDVQDTLLEDVERIEVIRGPGSAVWGANAVNGVINIITKNAANTQGWLISGEHEDFSNLSSAGVRYGGKIDESAHYRLFVKYFGREAMDESIDEMKQPESEPQALDVYSEDRRIDNWLGYRAGFRIDWNPPSGGNTGVIQGEGYYNQDLMETSIGDQRMEETSNISGAFILGLWKQRHSGGGESALQFYYDYTRRDSQQAKYAIDAADIDFRRLFHLTPDNEMSIGLGYRYIHDDIDNFYMVSFEPEEYRQDIFSAFIQDSMKFYDDKLRLIVGSKFEHNDYTGFEVQPTFRVIWTPKIHYSVWGAVSRAVRVPARYERDGKVFTKIDLREYMGGSGPESRDDKESTIIYQEIPNNAFDTEKVYAWEGGLRLQPTDFIWADLAVFYNEYNDLKQLVGTKKQGAEGRPENPDHLQGLPWDQDGESAYVYSHYPANNIEGKSYGFEISTDIKAFDRWRIKPSFSWLKIDLRTASKPDDDPEENDPDDDIVDDDFLSYRNVYMLEYGAPRWMFSIRSEFDITKQIDFDMGMRYVDSISLIGTEDTFKREIDAYLVFDVRLAWRPNKHVEISVSGRDLGPSHSELSQLEVCPTVMGKVTCRF